MHGYSRAFSGKLTDRLSGIGRTEQIVIRETVCEEQRQPISLRR